MRLLFAILLALSMSVCALAQQPAREIFPSDYTPSTCAPERSCQSFSASDIVSAAYRFYGLELDPQWVAAHAKEIQDAVAPLCRKHATCLARPGNSFTFCDDILAAESRPSCEKLFPKAQSPRDAEQCRGYLEIYLLGIEQHAEDIWKAAQACAAKQPPPPPHTKPLDVWLSPAQIPYEYKGDVTFYAIDPDTHVPVLAKIAFENQTLFAPANPAGDLAPYYPFKIPFKYVRIANKEGHTDAAPPLVTITAPGYPPTTLRLPAPVPQAVVEMKPAADALKPGDNQVTVFAHDSISGRPVDGRIMVGEDESGYTNQPITITLPKGGKRPEIWLKPYLNRYSDVVIAPAKK
jgi:hypothetical protein